MKQKTEKYIIKIPNGVSVIHCKKKNILTIKGPLSRKSLRSYLKIFVNKHTKSLEVSLISSTKISNKDRKKIKTLRGTTAALIKHKLIEASVVTNKKLKLHGMGYRLIVDEKLPDNRLLTFKLGYSHLLYFRIPEKLTVFCFSKTKLCIFGNYYQDISQISAQIRLNKKPEPYKGKGILYENETVTLKEGKKV